MKTITSHTKHKLSVKPSGLDVIWGSKLFINSQIVLQLVSKVAKYETGEESLHAIFSYANALNKRYRAKLYKELQQEVDEICFLEKEMKEGTIKPWDKEIIDFVISSTLITFTANIPRRNK